MLKLTWQDVVLAHRAIRAGLYRSEQEIWQAEADFLNARLAPTLPVSATRRALNQSQQRSRDILYSVPKFDECIPAGIRVRQLKRAINSTLATHEIIARKLSGYDDATWSKLREDRKRTYRRAANSLIAQWSEFAKLFEY